MAPCRPARVRSARSAASVSRAVRHASAYCVGAIAIEGFQMKELAKAALVAALTCLPGSLSAQGTMDRTIDQYKCRDVMREPGANRDVAVAIPARLPARKIRKPELQPRRSAQADREFHRTLSEQSRRQGDRFDASGQELTYVRSRPREMASESQDCYGSAARRAKNPKGREPRHF